MLTINHISRQKYRQGVLFIQGQTDPSIFDRSPPVDVRTNVYQLNKLALQGVSA